MVRVNGTCICMYVLNICIIINNINYCTFISRANARVIVWEGLEPRILSAKLNIFPRYQTQSPNIIGSFDYK